ncbi:class I tRNA ligase family protein [bacterium]|jgi:methionyl-tRNA synthetase|nr:class I tRNA ligase family protein [bacterium]MBR7036599.1 class I tRNA ligase family protein [bacterium]
MSKSLGNVVDPIQVSRDYDRDALVFYLLNDVPLGSDGDFSWERFN